MTDIERKHLKRADAYWNYQRARVLWIAAQNDIEVDLPQHDGEFLFDLFDGGDADITDEEILEALKELN